MEPLQLLALLLSTALSCRGQLLASEGLTILVTPATNVEPRVSISGRLYGSAKPRTDKKGTAYPTLPTGGKRHRTHPDSCEGWTADDGDYAKETGNECSEETERVESNEVEETITTTKKPPPPPHYGPCVFKYTASTCQKANKTVCSTERLCVQITGNPCCALPKDECPPIFQMDIKCIKGRPVSKIH